ncbi:imidazolonepropionase [Planctomycetes bacterium Pla163]|uniref:Imidazolonepropionase n=1 Tax=Rohdeia mirabilis TaxID=2528008 RepID=A0A518CV26_9BACT|nr:imidazolonepropionase [Planctomycetes bacterium Pla163]
MSLLTSLTLAVATVVPLDGGHVDRSSGLMPPGASTTANTAANAFELESASYEAALFAWQQGLDALDEAAKRAPEAGAVDGPGLALLASKVLTCELEGPGYVNRGVVLIRDGLIEEVGRQGEVEIPEDYEVVDCGQNWLMPGMVDLHAHIADEDQFSAVNDAVLLSNPGLRVSAAIIPGNRRMRAALASGITTLLFIPGSATTIGGQGALVKTAPGTMSKRMVKDSAALKVAQYGNPDRWGPRVGKSYLYQGLRRSLAVGQAYADAWREFEEGTGPEPAVDPDLEIYRGMFEGTVPVAIHTQWVQVVTASIDIMRRQFQLNIFIDHGTFDSWRVAAYAWEHGVNAIIGPRVVSMPVRHMIDWSGDNPERVQGSAAGFWEEGHRMIGFNTDSPNVPQDEFPLQAALAVRHGFPDDKLQTVRGLTIIPAITIGLGDRLGSLEAGKDADVVVLSGHPADPRTKVREVWVDGVKSFDEDVKKRAPESRSPK